MLAEDSQCYANIVQPGSGVIGVVYRCSSESLAKLDRFETGYERCEVNVVDEQNNVLAAVTYIASPDCVKSGGIPSNDYVQRILKGARSHNLPPDYIAAIVASITI